MNIFDNIFIGGMSIGTYLISALVAMVCGLLVALSTSFRSRITKSFFASLVLLPLAVQTVIVMVNGSVGTGIAVAGAFSLIRFRSVPGKAKDIVSVFAAMTAGLACAAGYVGIGVLFTLIACACMMIFGAVTMTSDKELYLKITIPETLNFEGTFDELFKKYTKRISLISVKSANMGSLFKLTYRIQMKKGESMREFVDEIRVRNGNLEVAIFTMEGTAEEL